MSSRSSISAAVLFALYGLPPAARADAVRDNDPLTLEEITVTASRRVQTTEEIPYAISVVSPADIAATSVTDLASLTRQIGVAGGASAKTSAITFPIIRGLNASPGSALRTIAQAPVGTYIDNSPIDGYFQLEDIQRVEVLRGPQGTLYGAGALGGTLRVIPNAPQLGKLAGDIDGRVGHLEHAGHAQYTATGMINIPIGETLAFRGAANYQYNPGFIDVYGLMVRSGPLGIPILADPSDPVNSSGVYTSKKDWNEQKTFTGRASLLWKPTSDFTATVAYLHTHAIGDAGTSVNPLFPGGPGPLDPRINFPAGGRYTTFSTDDQPYSRKSELTSLDLSYDVGFATLSATSSYFTNSGYYAASSEFALLRPQLIPFVPYYAGTPINPRWVAPDRFIDSSHTFSQEVRVVSNTGPDARFDYVLGLFYEKQSRFGSLALWVPGSPERAVAQGCTGPVFFGSSFPDCLVQTGPDDMANLSTDRQNFEDRSVFGELTWHPAKHWQITGGFRYFNQSFTDTNLQALYDFGVVQDPTVNSSSVSKVVGKASIAWEYTHGQHVYALWSQGFRRGGANGFLTSGAFADIAPGTYKPDTVNNYELGVKGRFDNGFSYSFDGFYINWRDPQVEGLTPNSNQAVWNARKANSKGFELDLNTPLGARGLNLTLGGTYADARLTENYSYPDLLGNIVGKSGEQLPFSPKLSTAATLSYARNLGSDYNLLMSLNNTYTTRVVTSTFAVLVRRGRPFRRSTS